MMGRHTSPPPVKAVEPPTTTVDERSAPATKTAERPTGPPTSSGPIGSVPEANRRVGRARDDHGYARLRGDILSVPATAPGLEAIATDTGARGGTLPRLQVAELPKTGAADVPARRIDTLLKDRELERIYLSREGAGTRARIAQAFDAGASLVSYQGHGGVASWASENVWNIGDVAGLAPRDPARLAYITQTTLSVDDTAEVVAALKARFPAIVGPRKEDICYATTNRQEAVKAMAPKIEALLVIGAPNSSNSQRLVEVGRRAGCGYAQLVQRAADIDWRALAGARSVGVTAGASAPEVLVEEVIAAFRARYDVTERLVETARERVEFKVPRVLRAKVA